MIHLGGRMFELIQEHKNGYNFEAFRDRYSDVLDRYDYIVGDWGYSQLRLKGFYKEASPKATRETSAGSLKDYLNEYCNFGCAYFILEKVPAKGGAALPPYPEAQAELSAAPEGQAEDDPTEPVAPPAVAGKPMPANAQANRWRSNNREPRATWGEPVVRESPSRDREGGARAAGYAPRDGQSRDTRGGPAMQAQTRGAADARGERPAARGPDRSRRHDARGRGKDAARGGAREPGAARDAREQRPPRDAHEARDPRQGREPRDRRDARQDGQAGGGSAVPEPPKSGQPS